MRKIRFEISYLLPEENVSVNDERIIHPQHGRIALQILVTEVKNWLYFLNQFSKIDDEKELAEEDKFQLFIQATKKGSQASDLVTSYPLTGQNYKRAIESLKTRLGRDNLQVEVYVLCALYDY